MHFSKNRLKLAELKHHTYETFHLLTAGVSHTHRPDNAGFLKFVHWAGLCMILTYTPHHAQLSDPPPTI
ncbi:MAG: hypothetical protein N2050_04485 [Flavobacteriales bacterium]|nr:hypothetical protein [Flavobacteriales bacterium]MCX7649795.1 hypothetical protein [Flavobacteriales bacterium]MDW8432567.1 hypothetical protein [Flavobacteriales bacterium]